MAKLLEVDVRGFRLHWDGKNISEGIVHLECQCNCFCGKPVYVPIDVTHIDNKYKYQCKSCKGEYTITGLATLLRRVKKALYETTIESEFLEPKR